MVDETEMGYTYTREGELALKMGQLNLNKNDKPKEYRVCVGVEGVGYGGIFLPSLNCQIIMSTCQIFMLTCQLLMLICQKKNHLNL